MVLSSEIRRIAGDLRVARASAKRVGRESDKARGQLGRLVRTIRKHDGTYKGNQSTADRAKGKFREKAESILLLIQSFVIEEESDMLPSLRDIKQLRQLVRGGEIPWEESFGPSLDRVLDMVSGYGSLG
mgnify:CR=1 FL=1|tara:strand:- start:3614 stop:4000 length:387 start_codon:yes stop_codon:yes gene_type:complete